MPQIGIIISTILSSALLMLGMSKTRTSGFRKLGGPFQKRLVLRAIGVALCIATLVGSDPTPPSSAQTYGSQQVLNNQIVMPFAGSVEITVNNAVTNSCDGNFGIQAPIEQELFSNYNDKRGQSEVVGPFAAGTELIFYIQPLSFCAPYIYPSTNTSHARVHAIAEGIWRIEWEDLPDNGPSDNDFDDLIITVRVAGAYPDFKQNIGDWADDIYDHNTNVADSIATWGCALTAVTNLLAYYGARDIDPGTFNSWMKTGGFTGSGGVVWTVADDFRPTGSDVHVMKWDRFVTRGDPTANMQAMIRESLERHWPVIVQYNMPSSPSGAHYLVLTDLVENPGDQHYVVRDPYSSASSITQIPENDSSILKAYFYQPADQMPRPSLTVYGLSPIDFLIVDALGRRLGYDPLSEQIYWEIPEASYDYDPPFWNPTGGDSNGKGSGLTASLPGASTGLYQLHVHGTGTGDFKIETFYDDGSSIKHALTEGNTRQGTSTLYDLEVGTAVMNIVPQQTVAVTAEPETVTPGGTSRISVAVYDGFGAPVAGQIVLFDSTLGDIPGSAVTDANGVASVILSAGMTQGVASVTTRVGILVNRFDVTVQGSSVFLPHIARAQPTPTATPVPPTQISIATNSQNSYQLQRSDAGEGIFPGKRVYTDRNYQYQDVPSFLQGRSYILTPNNDSVRYDLLLSVTVNKPITLYVAHTDRQTPKPAWLNTFQDTGEDLTFVDRDGNTVVLSVFSTSFPAGTVTLGANTPPNGDDHSMYTVAIEVIETASSVSPD
jgi:hypothetical protein